MPRIKDVNGITERRRAYDILRKALVLNRLPRGQRLREAEWSGRLGVNRCALREALGRLHSEGLVVEGEKTGYRVPEYTQQDLQEIVEVRCTLEGLAVGAIIRAGRNSREHLSRLHELCDELEWLLEREYRVEIVEADQLFHEALVELSGNRRVILLHRCLPQTLESDPHDRALDVTVRPRPLLRDHRQIVDALHKGQFRLARSLLQRHYGNDLLDLTTGPAAIAPVAYQRGDRAHLDVKPKDARHSARRAIASPA